MNPKVSIVIVNLDRADLTIDCIASVAAHTPRDRHEIIVVDNGSAMPERDKLARAPQAFTTIQLERNMFFGEASNIGAERASGEYVLFLNNDVTVTAGWLDALLGVLEREHRAGAVGAKILDPSGELLEAGCIVRPDGWGTQIGKRGTLFPPEFIDATRIVDYCSGACLLMRRNVFLGLGGFDPIFDPAYFEDADLAIRLRATGLFTYYCGAATVHHRESATSNQIWSAEERNRHIAANHARLLQRWGRYLRERIARELEPEPLPPVHWEGEAAAGGKPAVVFYSPAPLGVDARSELLLRAAASAHERCEVVLAADEIQSRCRIYSLGRHFGLGLTLFRTRKLSEVDQAAARLIVTADAEPGGAIQAPHIALPRDGAKLQQVLEGFTGGTARSEGPPRGG